MEQGAIAVLSLAAEEGLDRAIRAALARRGFEPATAPREGRPTLAVIDWGSDARAGALRAVRAASSGAPVFVLALVAGGDPGALDAALAAGADDVLAVPHEPLELEARLAVAARRLAALVRATENTAALTARLYAAERLAAVGTLAASVAHEVNNPLAYVIGNVAYAADRLRDAAGLPAVDDARQALEEARQGAERVRHIVYDLRALSRAPDSPAAPGEAPDDEDRAPVDVHQVLEGAIAMTRAEVWPRAELVQRFAPAVPLVRGNPTRLGQVFANLLVNAAQAVSPGVPGRERITVSTSFDVARDRVVVEVADSGPGIPPEILHRVFEPFFTTKPRGAGLGLGLSICQRIVAALGGEISAHNGVGGGAVFRVALVPASGAEIAAATTTPDDALAPPAASRTSLPPARRLRVLVIDDDPIVARAVQRTLAAEHDVVIADDARAALARLAGGETFDAILCDLIMPGMGGVGFYEALAQRAPDALRHVAFLSGGGPDADAQQFARHVGARCLSKPFDPRSLRAAVRELAATA